MNCGEYFTAINDIGFLYARIQCIGNINNQLSCGLFDKAKSVQEKHSFDSLKYSTTIVTTKYSLYPSVRVC